MKKFCVFCGKRPESKTKEHVIPQWLIELTGEPSRKVNLGYDWYNRRLRQYSFNQLKFPACQICNTNFSKLEDQTKNIVKKILKEKPLSDTDFSTLLSWFDKVRVGIWLGFLLLNKDFFGIDPRFHIETRIDVSDRMLLLYKASDDWKGLMFSGPDNPFFYWQPSFFRLVINNYYFINVSNDFLISRRLGLPFPTEKRFAGDGKTYYYLAEGIGRIITPLIKKYYDKRCTEIFQPIIRPELLTDKLYDNEYVRHYFNLSSSNKGKILMNYNNRIVEYGNSSDRWIPQYVHEGGMLKKLTTETLFTFQEIFIDEMPCYDDLTTDRRAHLKMGISLGRKYSKMIKEKIRYVK